MHCLLYGRDLLHERVKTSIQWPSKNFLKHAQKQKLRHSNHLVIHECFQIWLVLKFRQKYQAKKDILQRWHFLSDCNRIRNYNHLVCKRAFNSSFMVKWLSVHLQTIKFRVRILLQSLKFQISRLFSCN